MKNEIYIKNACIHNLKSISLKIPKNKLIVITGVSGSGKSSLAFDTIYAEGQRRYVKSLNTYARQFLGVAAKPQVEKITGMSPAISIEQKKSNYNPRSIVGTITEIYDHLRVLYARVGKPFCINGHGKIKSQTLSEIKVKINQLFKSKIILILSPIKINNKDEFKEKIKMLINNGFIRILLNNEIAYLNDTKILYNSKIKLIHIIVDRFMVELDNDLQIRLYESLVAASQYSNKLITIKAIESNKITKFSEANTCLECAYSIDEIKPRFFSFNSPEGACKKCSGLGFIFGVNTNLLFDYEKTINEGGIEFLKNIVNTSNRLWQEFVVLAGEYKINLDTKISDLEPQKIKIILNGSTKRIKYKFKTEDSKNVYYRDDYIEGVGKRINRLYNETTSEHSRNYYKSFMAETKCTKCNGLRLNKRAQHIFIKKINISDLCKQNIYKIQDFIESLYASEKYDKVFNNLFEEILARLGFLISVGIGYLTLSRKSSTLSGGEFQRIRLATQIGSQLTGVIYVLDEPSIGLHQSDNYRLIESLKKIRDLGNTVIVVEHDEETMLKSDYIIDIGPGAGNYGGKVVATGKPKDFIKNENSETAKYLTGKKVIKNNNHFIKVKRNNVIKLFGARENNLKNLNVDFPLNMLVCITGVSGSGKSTLINDILYNALQSKFGHKVSWIGKHSKISGWKRISRVVMINQKAIGKTSRSNPATYIGVFSKIRELFALCPESKVRGYNPGRFSFNVSRGRCQKCRGSGKIRIEMLFMADIYINCDLCNGKRYNHETLQIFFKGKNIYDVLEMTVVEAIDFFKYQKNIYQYLLIMEKVGLGYIKLGQPSTQLSGGESQRVKLVLYLYKKSDGNTLYILDEPTTGLHFSDIEKLMQVIFELRNRNDSIIIIEHNLDVIKMADYIIDLGPGGGEKGGKIIACGNQEKIIDSPLSLTGKWLEKKILLDKKRRKNQ